MDKEQKKSLEALPENMRASLTSREQISSQVEILSRQPEASHQLDTQKEEHAGVLPTEIQDHPEQPVSSQSVQESVKAAETTLLDLDYAIAVVMEAGVMFLESGAEVYRAEDTINRLGRSIPGVEDCVSYVTVTGIMCSMVSHGQTVTRIARVGKTGRNLTVINAVNQLSRNAVTYHLNSVQIARILQKIRQLPVYSPGVLALCAAIGAMGFAVFFGASLREMAAVFVIGLLIQMLAEWLSRLELNQIFVNGLAAFAAALLSRAAHGLIPLSSVDLMTLSSIMLLVPGLTLTNAIRDTVMGEYLSGVVRSAEALIIATSIAVGVALGLYI